MASAASSQHRCVFVGNIPYDVTEEQLIQICEEVGPVVSFRLVLDRETGKPKGYGFCEYKDEETALSARRNLQGYEINGRQLRVDFAENDKGNDRNREQGRGGPGFTSNSDAQRPSSGPPVLGDSSLHQPIGLQVASTAASVMAKTLSGSQYTNSQSHSGLGNDPLTHHLAKMSRHQLNETMNEMKVLATQNKPMTRQLLQGCSQLPKALFQAQIMLGLVSPQMMQMVGNRQSSGSAPQPSLKDNTQDQNPLLPSYLGQTSSQKDAFGIYSRHPSNQVPNILPNSMDLQQSASPLQYVPGQHQLYHPSLQNQVDLQGMILGKSGTPLVPSLQRQSLDNLSIQLQNPHLHNSKGLISQGQPPLLQHPRPIGGANTSHLPHLPPINSSLNQPPLPHPATSQIGSSSRPVLFGPETLSKDKKPSASANQDLTWSSRLSRHPSSGVGLVEQTGKGGDMSELANHPSKRRRLEDGNNTLQVMNNSSVLCQSIAAGSSLPGTGSQVTTAGLIQQSEKQMPQVPPELDPALLQQVMSLTPEQLSSLPLEQQQQVLQLQQMLR